jgi:hypothetical protein
MITGWTPVKQHFKGYMITVTCKMALQRLQWKAWKETMQTSGHVLRMMSP